MGAGAIDLARVNQNQVRFLFNHNSNDVIGVVERIWMEGAALCAVIRFADTPRGREFAGMVQRSELTGISIGYQVRNWKLVEVLENDHEIWRATEWELLEASLVSVPADPNAGVRSLNPGNPSGSAAPQPSEDDMRRSLLAGGMLAALGERTAPRSTAERIELYERAFHTTSDFPILLSGALNQRLAEQYRVAQPIYRSIAQQMTFVDFRPHEVLRPGDFPTLKPVNEAGEIKFGTFGEGRERVAVGAYGIQFGLSRQLMINDHIGAIDRVLASQGNMIALFEELTFFAMKAVNSGDGPNLLEDGKSVFHADHNNKAGTGTAITEAALSAGRAAIRKQKTPAGAVMGTPPSILLVSPDKETEADKAVAARPNGEYNPFEGKLRTVVAGQLTGNSWELYADQAFGANWTWGLLDGFTAPRLRVENVFGQQGVKISLEHDFGCGAQDFRFGYRNAGN